MVPYMLQVRCTVNEVSYRLDVDTWFRRWRFHIKRHNIDPYPSPDGTIWNRQRNNEKHDDALLNCDVHRFRTKSSCLIIYFIWQFCFNFFFKYPWCNYPWCNIAYLTSLVSSVSLLNTFPSWKGVFCVAVTVLLIN